MYFYNGRNALSKKTLEVVKQTKNDAIIQLKANQKKLHEAIKFISEHNQPLSGFTQRSSKKHGRIEARKTEVFEVPELARSLNKSFKGWENIVCFAKVERGRKVLNSKKKKDKEAKKQVSYYICTKILGAKELSEIIQGHWGVENKVNYVKDVEFKEDKSRIREKPGIFSRLRSPSLNEMRLNGAENISQERFSNCLNINFALNYKGIA